VIEAADGEQALRLIEEADHPVDLLLTDVVMPGMSGTELVEAIAVRDPRTRVLFMSGYSDDLIARHGVAVGAQPLVHKPFQAEDLIAAVSEVMSRPTTARGGDPADVPN
jgi:YesN/AraC family two-component response regulator